MAMAIILLPKTQIGAIIPGLNGGHVSTPSGSLWVEQKLFFTVIDELQAFVFSIGCIAWFGLVIFFYRHCGSVCQNQSESEAEF